MDIRISEILFLVGAAFSVASAFRRRRQSPLRLEILEPVAILFVAVSVGLIGREAAIAGRTDGATATLIAAFVMGVAAAVIVARQVRA